MSIKYIALIISQGEICMDPVKVARVMDWPTPTKKKEVQSFLGFMNFHCQCKGNLMIKARGLILARENQS
jgi:hypothetical protein